MLRCYHVSDVHFHGATDRNAQSLLLLQRLHGIMKPANDHLVVTGDITENGNTAEYGQAVGALSRFKGRLLAVPGNHDYAAVGNVYDPARAERFETDFVKPLGLPHRYIDKVPVVDVLSDGAGTQVLAVGLNSNPMRNGAVGEIGRAQLHALDRVLSRPETAPYWKLVYLHHQVKTGGDFVDWLTDADELIRVMKGRVHVIAFGHTQGAPVANYPPQPGDTQIALPQDGLGYRINGNRCVEFQETIEVLFQGLPGPKDQPKVTLIGLAA